MSKFQVGEAHKAIVDGDEQETSIVQIKEGTPLVGILREIKRTGKPTTVDMMLFLPGTELDWLIETLQATRARF